MYGKIFDSIYDGTLAEDWRALITFQQFIVLCDADGIVDMTHAAISRRTGIPIEHIKAGIIILEAPDQYSRKRNQQGKRIELIDSHRPWGWHVINHEHYKVLKDADTVRAQTKERVRKHRASKACNADVTLGNAPKRHIDTDTDTDTKKKGRFTPPSLEDVTNYCKERDNTINPDTFVDFYTANGWVQSGNKKIKDWKACMRTWEQREKKKEPEYDPAIERGAV